MQEDIDEMIPHGFQLVHQIIETIGGHTERTIRLMTRSAGHFTSPKIVMEQVVPRRLRSEIWVFLDCWFVIIDYTAVEGVEVG